MNHSTNQTAQSRREALATLAVAGAATGALALLSGAANAQNKAPLTAQDPTPATGAPATGAPVTGAPAMAPNAKTKAAALPASDLDIVRFALTMERLEASFYAQVVTAHQERAFLPDRSFALAQQIAAAEADHVRALEGVLSSAGAEVPDAPTFQFPRDVFISPIAYAWFAYTIEEIGIGAYLGAVGKIQDDGLRKSAAAIYGAETRHAAILRTLAGFTFAPRYYESPLTVDQVTRLITPYIVA